MNFRQEYHFRNIWIFAPKLEDIFGNKTWWFWPKIELTGKVNFAENGKFMTFRNWLYRLYKISNTLFQTSIFCPKIQLSTELESMNLNFLNSILNVQKSKEFWNWHKIEFMDRNWTFRIVWGSSIAQKFLQILEKVW